MGIIHVLSFAVLALGNPIVSTLSSHVKPQKTINGTAEYATACKTCPYALCNNVLVPWYDEAVTLTCWTNGDLVGDTRLWLKTVDNCYITEYDLVEYAGDFSADLAYCGPVPLKITKQPAEVKYLSECKWGYGTSSESTKFYGRDVDVTLTCWADGSEIMQDPYWYKTTDNCHVSGSGLWKKPDRSRLDNCGPSNPNRINETKRAIEDDVVKPRTVDLSNTKDKALSKRWLEPGKIGEEYAGCYSCPTNITSSTCHHMKTYEYNQTVISQCYSDGWMLTTDWCYVDSFNFWEPPYDHYRYPSCSNWGYQ